MAEKPVGNRSSEGVVAIRHPRTDVPQFGWIAKPNLTGTTKLYEAVSDYGWYSASQSYRPYEKTIKYGSRRGPQWDFYQTNPQQGWLAKPVVDGTTTDLYEARTDYGWWSQSQSYRPYEQTRRYGPTIRGPNRGFYQTEPQQGWLLKPVVDGTTADLYEARTDFGWYPPTQTPRVDEHRGLYGPTCRARRAPYQTEPQQGWLLKPVVAGTTTDLYEANTGVSWFSQSQSYRPNEPTSKYGSRRGPQRAYYQTTPHDIFNANLFDQPLRVAPVAQLAQPWRTPTRPLGRWQPDLDQAWITENVPIVVVTYDPLTQFPSVGIPDTRMGRGVLYRRATLDATSIPVAREAVGSAAGIAYTTLEYILDELGDPILDENGVPIEAQSSAGFISASSYPWAHGLDIPSAPYQSRTWWTSDPPQFSWLVPSVIFDPALYQGASPADRMGTRPRGQRPSDLDQAWISQNLTVAYDPLTQFPSVGIPADRMGPKRVYRRQTSDLLSIQVAREAVGSASGIAYTTLEYILDELGDPILDETGQPIEAESSAGFISASIYPWVATIGVIPADRMRPRARLVVQRYQSLYDLSWVHDVIPLTDPPATSLRWRVVRGDDHEGLDDWFTSWQG